MNNQILTINEPEQKAAGQTFTTKFEYNQYGQVIKKTDGVGNVVNYVY